VNIPGLSDVIRKEQDAKNEMATLVTYIANQNSQQDTKQNPQVVEQMRKRLFELEGLRKGYKAAIQKGYPEYFQLIQPKAPARKRLPSSWLKMRCSSLSFPWQVRPMSGVLITKGRQSSIAQIGASRRPIQQWRL